MKRYFLITFAHTRGTGDIEFSCNGFPSKAYINVMVKEKYNLEIKSVRNIFEFKSKSDYMSWLSGRTTDNEEVKKDVIDVDYDKLMAFFNANCKNIPLIKSLTPQRKVAVNSIIKKFSKEDLINVIKQLKDYDFLQGINDRGWTADFDWIIKQQNFIKITEGRFSNNRVKDEPIKF